MSDLRPRPTLIGTTENALRALLGGLLAESPIRSYERWVAMSAIAAEPAPAPQLTSSLADALDLGDEVVNEILAGLELEGLTHADGHRIAISSVGNETLGRARSQVSSVTKRLVADLAPEDVAATRRVLEAVRSAAQARKGKPGAMTHAAMSRARQLGSGSRSVE